MKVLVGNFTGRELHAGIAHVEAKKVKEKTGLSKIVTEVFPEEKTYLKSVWLTN